MKRILIITLCALLIFALSSCDVFFTSVPEPANGYVFEGITADYGSSSLTVTTVGTDGHYFILVPISLYCSAPVGSFEQIQFKYVTAGSCIKFYAHGESTVEMLIPMGEYEIYYATGEVWYGEEELFGKNTVYSKCDGTFDFYDESGQMFRIPNGNLYIYKIEADEFPN